MERGLRLRLGLILMGEKDFKTCLFKGNQLWKIIYLTPNSRKVTRGGLKGNVDNFTLCNNAQYSCTWSLTCHWEASHQCPD